MVLDSSIRVRDVFRYRRTVDLLLLFVSLLFFRKYLAVEAPFFVNIHAVVFVLKVSVRH